MLSREFDNSIFYKIGCDCMEDEHTKTVELEYDEETRTVQMIFYADLQLDDYYTAMPWWEKPWFRIKKAVRMLVFGKIETQTDFLWADTKSIDDFIEALQEGREKLKNWKP